MAFVVPTEPGLEICYVSKEVFTYVMGGFFIGGSVAGLLAIAKFMQWKDEQREAGAKFAKSKKVKAVRKKRLRKNGN